MSLEWPVRNIGEVATVVNGGTPDTKIKEYWGNDILWITPKDMGKLESIYVDNTERKITKAGLKNSSAKIIPPNSIILSSRAPIGHLAINKKEMTTNQGCKGIIPKNDISIKFLYYFLKKSIELLNRLGTGTTFKELSSSKLNEVQIPLPSLPEQQRIIEILDQSFAAIDQAIEYTEKNSANVQDLFTVYLDLLISNSKNNWKETCLEDLYDVRDGTHESPKFLDSGYPFITSKNLKGDVINFDNIKFISKEDYDSFNKRSKVNKGDILFAMIGTIGNPVVVEIEPNFAIKNVALLKVPSSQSNHYLKYYLQSKSVMSRFIDNAKGTTQRFVGLGNLRKTKIILPPLDEQLEIVEKLNSFSSNVKKLKFNFQQKKFLIQELKQSLLHKAFKGQL